MSVEVYLNIKDSKSFPRSVRAARGIRAACERSDHSRLRINTKAATNKSFASEPDDGVVQKIAMLIAAENKLRRIYRTVGKIHSPSCIVSNILRCHHDGICKCSSVASIIVAGLLMRIYYSCFELNMLSKSFKSHNFPYVVKVHQRETIEANASQVLVAPNAVYLLSSDSHKRVKVEGKGLCNDKPLFVVYGTGENSVLRR